MAKLKSKSLLVVLMVFSLIIFFTVLNRDVIFQEGNPIPFAMAISNMVFTDKEIVKVKSAEKVDGIKGYLVKRGEVKPYITIMKKKGWNFVERREKENTLLFVKAKGNIGYIEVSYKNYTRYYTFFSNPY